MAFGFPAHHEESIPVPGQPLDALVRDVFGLLGWSLEESDGKDRWTAKVGTSLSSWGERFIVERAGETTGELRLRSECRLPTQCFDWGKNKRNVVDFKVAMRAAQKG